MRKTPLGLSPLGRLWSSPALTCGPRVAKPALLTGPLYAVPLPLWGPRAVLTARGLGQHTAGQPVSSTPSPPTSHPARKESSQRGQTSIKNQITCSGGTRTLVGYNIEQTPPSPPNPRQCRPSSAGKSISVLTSQSLESGPASDRRELKIPYPHHGLCTSLSLRCPLSSPGCLFFGSKVGPHPTSCPTTACSFLITFPHQFITHLSDH